MNSIAETKPKIQGPLISNGPDFKLTVRLTDGTEWEVCGLGLKRCLNEPVKNSAGSHYPLVYSDIYLDDYEDQERIEWVRMEA